MQPWIINIFRQFLGTIFSELFYSIDNNKKSS